MSKRLYFPNLNGLRAIAAMLVLIYHVEWLKSAGGVTNSFAVPWINNSGEFGVSLFFVLSGFLITYLLLEERRRIGDIKVGAFYVRRVLRIWPLYYLTVALAFFALPRFVGIPGLEPVALGDAFWRELALFVFFLPNLCHVMFPFVPFASQLWSIGVEEQFYAIWPWIVREFGDALELPLIGIVIFTVGARLALARLSAGHPQSGYLTAMYFLYHFRIHCMAFGSLGAYLAARRRGPILDLIYSMPAQWTALALGVFIYSRPKNFLGPLTPELLEFIFALVVTNLATNPDCLLSLESRPFRFLGDISYGLYVYNVLAIRLSFLLVKRAFGFPETPWASVPLYLASFGLTVVLASISYFYFERRFLALKDRFSVVLTNTPISPETPPSSAVEPA